VLERTRLLLLLLLLLLMRMRWWRWWRLMALMMLLVLQGWSVVLRLAWIASLKMLVLLL